MKLSISSRELEILRKTASGQSAQEIAGELSITPQSVSKYQKEILHKTHAANPIHALQSLAKHGFVLVEDK
jgi:DNA-binding CsgD family transcriptional regulator